MSDTCRTKEVNLLQISTLVATASLSQEVEYPWNQDEIPSQTV